MVYASEFVKWSPRVVEATLAVAIVWAVFQAVSPFEVSTAAVTEKPETVQKVELNIEQLAKSGLFGKVDGKAKAAPKPQVVVPSRLNLKLAGTIVSGKHAAAIITGAGNKQQMHRVGDLIQPGVKLVEVMAETIVVEHRGKLERIVMEKKKAQPRAMNIQTAAKFR